MQGLGALVEHIANCCGGAGAWHVSPEEATTLLGVDAVTFWRSVHGARDRIGFGDAVDGWTQDTVGDLVTVLETLFGTDAEAQFVRAGLFIPWSLGVGLIEEMLFRARRFAVAHPLQQEELESMLRHTGSVRKAIEIYLDAHLDLDALVEECAQSFRVLQGLPAVGAVTAGAWIRRMLGRHLLDREALTVALRERLRLAAAALGFIDPDEARVTSEGPDPEGYRDGRRTRQERSRGSHARARSEEGSRRAWARRVMGLSPAEVSAEGLRARYRELMMRYHPDADPAGLERCKDVNVAYSLLIAEAAAR